MTTVARDRLARMLRGDVADVFSVALTVSTDVLSLAVDGVGPVAFPVSSARAQELLGLGEPARFGRGEETLTDPGVRDTWEIPKERVHASWDDDELNDILTTVKDELGLPITAELTADLHSLLVYEPGQFFRAHQDSEKDDLMIGTLVVALPSEHTGGELVVRHLDEKNAYRGSTAGLSLVAFYADCRHEVARVRSGHRIALTYNLLLSGDTAPSEGDEGAAGELAGFLREHFSTPVLGRYGAGPSGPPNRLVYLLDHEYTPRALGWRRLKGADAARGSLVRAAAEVAGYEAVLALADIKTTHSAYEADDYYGNRGRGYRDDGEEDEDTDDPADLEIQELIESTVMLTHWTGPDGDRLEATSLDVGEDEVCASTGTDDFEPYTSDYEGYMGNWGNTLDRWYHRAAIVVWPREQSFANRAETSPGWALDALAEMAPTDAQAAAATLEPFWDGALRLRTAEDSARISETFGKALRTADAVADAATASMLLRPFRVEYLTPSDAAPFVKLPGRYGRPWTEQLLRTWTGVGQPRWTVGGPERGRWVANSLPGLCAGLRAAPGVGEMAARLLVGLAWTWLREAIDGAARSTSPRSRDGGLHALGAPLASVLTAAATTGSADTRDTVLDHVRRQQDAVTALEMPALRAAAAPTGDDTSHEAGFGDLAADCAARLRSRLALPRRAATDWSITLAAGGCGCDLCETLRGFLADPSRRTLDWPLAEQRRRHVHSRIDAAELPVSHVTRRQGRPYTLVLQKTDALFTDELTQRARDQEDLDWLVAEWHLAPAPRTP
ncbi:2OG-Fe(II) oxygenase [Frankia canadensis]|uniref:2OG-Fe(II) oxygenase n=1 Tax=Frankia canadensis TaxID=1836972 RepID=A0A2I2KZG2_9ACTN|nr:2OG-Fe(II) oxygenase [Frankia canadensis]SNQ51048.1 2OG-Fe(II) oxygenase [Frankia canadensis]SOU58338.1 2OG-Fe(II) oxygenase [Frankia canadensis]